MIYFEKGLLQFPRHFDENPTRMVVINELTGTSYEILVVNMSDNPRYYAFDFSDVELDNGTYRYQVGNEVGLMQVGDYVAQTTQYNEKKQNVVYER